MRGGDAGLLGRWSEKSPGKGRAAGQPKGEPNDRAQPRPVPLTLPLLFLLTSSSAEVQGRLPHWAQCLLGWISLLISKSV